MQSQGSPVSGISSAGAGGGLTKPDLLQQQQQACWLTGVVNHLLLWILIIAVLTTTRLPPITKKCVCARSPHGDETFGWVQKHFFFLSSCGIFIIYPLLLSCQCCLRVNLCSHPLNHVKEMKNNNNNMHIILTLFKR